MFRNQYIPTRKFLSILWFCTNHNAKNNVLSILNVCNIRIFAFKINFCQVCSIILAKESYYREALKRQTYQRLKKIGYTKTFSHILKEFMARSYISKVIKWNKIKISRHVHSGRTRIQRVNPILRHFSTNFAIHYRDLNTTNPI